MTPARDVTPPLAAIRWDQASVAVESIRPIVDLAVAFLKGPALDVLDRDPEWRVRFLVEQLTLQLVERDETAAAYREAMLAALELLHMRDRQIAALRGQNAALREELLELRRTRKADAA